LAALQSLIVFALRRDFQINYRCRSEVSAG